jgi:tRNA(fMet)-specific endonuclease VapC
VIHADSSFLIALSRELKRRQPGPAQAFLAAHGNEPLVVSDVVRAELYAGIAVSPHPDAEAARLRAILEVTESASLSEQSARRYGELYGELRRRGTTVGSMDLLIAAIALVADAPLLTANHRDFARIPGLRVLSY